MYKSKILKYVYLIIFSLGLFRQASIKIITLKLIKYKQSFYKIERNMFFHTFVKTLVILSNSILPFPIF